MSGMHPPPCYVAEVAAAAVAMARAPARTAPRIRRLVEARGRLATQGVDLTALLAAARATLAGGGNPGGE